MEYKVEDVSPVSKKVDVTISPEEVSAAIGAALALYKKNAELDGFRKGKAPAAVIEKKFHDSIYKEAKEDLINVQLNQILDKLSVKPVSGIKMQGDDKPLEKGQPFSFTMEFEIMPQFDLPPYEGLEVTQRKVSANDQTVGLLLERMRSEHAKIAPVEGNAPAKDGQIANMDFEAWENGVLLDDFKTTNFDLEIGNRQALPEFENFIKEIPVGHTAEKVIHFPDDFLAKSIAGKDITMKVTVHAVKERRLPEENDEFAKSVGFESIDALRDSLSKAYVYSMTSLARGEAQKKLLDNMLKQTDFPLPKTLVDMETNLLLGDRLERMARNGRRPSGPEEIAQMREKYRPEGETRAREKVLLMTIADKEHLSVEPREVEEQVYRSAQKMGMGVREFYDNMRETGMIFQLRDNMLCDKAMDLVYERAKVRIVDEDENEDAATEVKSEAKEQE